MPGGAHLVVVCDTDAGREALSALDEVHREAVGAPRGERAKLRQRSQEAEAQVWKAFAALGDSPGGATRGSPTGGTERREGAAGSPQALRRSSRLSRRQAKEPDPDAAMSAKARAEAAAGKAKADRARGIHPEGAHGSKGRAGNGCEWVRPEQTARDEERQASPPST